MYKSIYMKGAVSIRVDEKFKYKCELEEVHNSVACM